MRRMHTWGAWLVAVPAGVVFLTGVLLLVRSELAWMQKPAMKGARPGASISFDEVLALAKSVPEAEVDDLNAIKQVRLLPSRGIFQVRVANGYELQIDAHTGELLASGLRGSSIVIALHDGTFFSKGVSYAVFLPTGILLIVLWLTGAYLAVKGRKPRRRAKGATRLAMAPAHERLQQSTR